MFMAILRISNCLPLYFKLDLIIVRFSILLEFILAGVHLTSSGKDCIPPHLLNNLYTIESSFDEDLFTSETTIFLSCK